MTKIVYDTDATQEFDWLSDASGNATKDITGITGFLTAIETIPGASGGLTTALPTTLYDITIKDPYGYDIAVGELANRSGTV
ncbi:MAG: hypothetical protein Q8L68_02340, partial [Methylococcales bacterium]|nr:hypothetical protein [Methylococcales bacterium]